MQVHSGDSDSDSLPSDFEDEEIDEDMAFTKEDRHTLGAMLGEEYSDSGEDASADMDAIDEPEGIDDKLAQVRNHGYILKI